MISGRPMATDSAPGERQYHLHVGPGEIGAYVLLPGDPARTDVIAQRLEQPRLVADHRSFRTWTGELSATPVSVVSTGIGCPSAAIAVSELLRLGAHTFVRVGSCGAIQDDLVSGHLIIVTGAVRDEGTTRQYVPVEFPAVASPQVVAALEGSARALGRPARSGIVYCKDAITAAFPPEEIPLSEVLALRTNTWIKARVLASEMESSALFVIAYLAGARAGSVLQVLRRGDSDNAEGFAPIIDVAIKAIRQLIAQDQQAE